MTIDDTLKARIVTALRAGDRNARNPEDRNEARELVYLLTVVPVVAPAVDTSSGEVPADADLADALDTLTAGVVAPKGKRSKQGKGEAGE